MLQEKEKINICQIKFLMNCMMLTKKKDQRLKKEKTYTKWQRRTRLLLILGGKKLWLERIHETHIETLELWHIDAG